MHAIDGPLTGKHIPNPPKGETWAMVYVDTTPRERPSLMPTGSVPVRRKTVVRTAIYELVNDEDGTARFVGWEDEQKPGPLANAMANASDDDILKLINDASDAKRR